MPLHQFTDAGVVAELGQRLARHRTEHNLTQSQFADRAGVGRSTVQRIEMGESIQLSSFVKILRALDRLDALDAVVPPEVRSPVAELERERRRRQQVRGKSAGDGRADEQGSSTWTWGDDEETR